MEIEFRTKKKKKNEEKLFLKNTNCSQTHDSHWTIYQGEDFVLIILKYRRI